MTKLFAHKSKIRLGRPLIVFLLLLAAYLGQNVIAQMLPHLQFEAESGTLSGNVAQASDVQAASGAYIGFSQPSTGNCPSGQVGTPPNCFSANSALGINAGTFVNNFDRKMKGIGLANWTFIKGWGKPLVGDIQGLPQAMQAIDPGLIRYAGGLWANWVGFSRNRTQQIPGAWVANGQTYYYNYGTDELANLDAFAKSINADVMIQVNVSNNDPGMWADLVRYVKERGFTNIKYYELSNELDLETFVNRETAITPAVYASRVAAYQQAMLAVDPNIKIVGGVPATLSDIMRAGYGCCGNQVSAYIMQGLPAARAAGRDWDTASYHWYQQGDGTTIADMFRWNWNENFSTSSGDWWRNSYVRRWSGDANPWLRNAMSGYPNVNIGISELGVASADGITFNANHAAAVWYSDILGRMAYTGVDWVTQWDSYASQGEYFSIMYPSNDQTTTPTLHARPTYYAYLLYSKYFGDQMVQSHTFDQTKVSIWASKDSDDPGKLKLRITNMTDSPITAPVAWNGFNATSGQAYVMSSTNPTDSSAASTTSSAPTTINGVKINGMNVNGSLASIQPGSVSINNGNHFNYTIPAYSSVAIVLTGSFN